MKHAYSILAKHPYLTLAMLSLLLITEMGLAYFDFVPIPYEWIFGWFLFLTLLAWGGMVGFAGVTRPVTRSMVKYTRLLLMAPLLIATVLFIADWTWALIITVVILPFVLTLIGAITLADVDAIIYLILVVIPLNVTAWFWLWALASYSPFEYVVLLIVALQALAIPLFIGYIILRVFRRSFGKRFLNVVLLGISVATIAIAGVVWSFGLIAAITDLALVILAIGIMPGAALISMMKYPYRNIAVSAVGLCSIIIVVGWFWVWVMDNGLDSFTGEEHAAAERFLQESCVERYDIGYRIYKNDGGYFVLDLSAWWRLPLTCETMPEGWWTDG